MTSATGTTSAGMPPIAPVHDGLDVTPVQATPSAIIGLAGEGKAQLTSALGGVADAVHELADKLASSGGAPIARYVHDAADTVEGWSASLDGRSVDELVGDTRAFVRTSPGVAVGIAVIAGFAVARLIRAASR